jgi:tetratricopeptide (TPR) repeat protein
MHSRRAEHAAAIADYTEAFRLDPSLSRALAARGNAQLRMGSFEQAADDYRAALQIDPDDAETERNLAVASRRDPPGSGGHAAVGGRHEQVQPE